MRKKFQDISQFIKDNLSSANNLSYWLEIAEGSVIIDGASGSYIPMNETSQDHVEAFLMARYPVTNEEFSRFIMDGGYDNQAVWTQQGWYYRIREKWTQPKYFDDPDFSQADHPVVGITWYEAMAYCQWLNTLTNEEIDIPDGWATILPSEQEWQRAAQGNDDRSYPWGNDFVQGFANTRENGLETTTSVRQYSQNVSPFAVADMVGNVLEWTCTDWDSGSNDLEMGDCKRILRGGSFANSQAIASVTARTYSNAYFRKSNFGFRIIAIPFAF